MGEAKTPQAFRSACNTFKLLEVISTEESEEEKVSAISGENDLEVTSLKEIKKSIYKIIDENANRGKDTYIGEIGSKLSNKYPDFDVRNYGCTKLSTLLEDKMSSFILTKKNTSTMVTIKREDMSKAQVEEQMIRILKSHGGKCNNMATLNEGLKQWNKNFSAKKFGYSKFASFIQSFGDIVEVNNNEVKLIKK